MSNEELARKIIDAIDAYLPDAERHRADARRVVEELLDQYRAKTD